MRRLDRYIIAEIIGPLTLGFFVYTMILLMQALFKSAELIIRSGVELATVGRLLLLSMPWIVVMTIPMSFLFSILIAVGRLSADSELVAIRASGISLFSLYRPILLLSLVLAGLNVYLMIEVLPQGNHALQKLRLEILTQSLTDEVEARIPHIGWQNKMLYVFESPAGEQRWKGTFLADAVPTQHSEITVAEWGEARTEGDEVLMTLTNAVIHAVDLDHPEDYRLAFNDVLNVRLATLTTQRATSSVKRSLRELSFRELMSRALDASVPEEVQRLAKVEMHKKFSLPAACLVFGLLALPLGFSNVRGGRSSGFAISIGVVLVYYVLLNAGEDFAREGTMPAALAVWMPNIILLVAGLFLLARKNRDKSLLLANMDRLIQENLWGRVLRIKERRAERREVQQQAKEDRSFGGTSKSNLRLRLPDLSLRFPNSIDRYVLATFFRVLILATLSGVVVYLVADLTDSFDEILENKVSRQVVFDYYKFKSFFILYQISPIIVLVTTLITFGLLSRTNEIIACKALGMSLYRLSIPVILAALFLATAGGILQSEVLSAANVRAAELEDIIKGRENSKRAPRMADRRWLYGKGNQLYNFAFYDEKARELNRLQIFRFDEDYRLIGRLMAEHAVYIEDGWWMLSGGWARSWVGREETDFSRFDEPLRYRLEDPAYFQGGLRKPEEMGYVEMRDYVSDLKARGQDVPALEVALYNKITYPVISLVMALVALPFAFRLGRQGALYGIGLSLILGVVLLIVLGVFNALGENGILPPLVAVWSPSVLFSIFSMYLFLGVRT
jgi:LPS export ABC transporter permease LptG/LPS export ABC transporter permease LptF